MRKGVPDEVNSADDESSRQGTPQASSKTQKSRELTQREVARMKNKKAVLAKIQENEKAKASRKADSLGPEEEREAKKPKPQTLANDADVKMDESA